MVDKPKPVSGKVTEGMEKLDKETTEIGELLRGISKTVSERPLGGSGGTSKAGKPQEVAGTRKGSGVTPYLPTRGQDAGREYKEPVTHPKEGDDGNEKPTVPITPSPVGPPTPAQQPQPQGPSWYILTVHVSPTGAGVTTPGPGEYLCAPRTGTQVSQRPNPGYTFDHWEIDGGGIITTPSPLTLLMDRNHTVFAVFAGAAPPKEIKSIVTQGPKDRFRTETQVTQPTGESFRTEVTGEKGGPVRTEVSGGMNVGQRGPWEIKGPPKKPEIGIDANPREVIVGGSTTLSWASKNATSVELSSNSTSFPTRPISHSGSMRVDSLSSTITFTATARGPGGDASAQVEVFVRRKTEKEKFAEDVGEQEFREKKKEYESGYITVRFTGIVEEEYTGGTRPVAGANVTLHRMSEYMGGTGGGARRVGREALGGARRFFGPGLGRIRIGERHGEQIGDPAITGEDGKYVLKVNIPKTDLPLQVNLVARRPGYEEGSERIDIPKKGFEGKDVQFKLKTTSRPRKEMPIRERVRGEFYQHFGWGGLIQTLVLTAIAVVIYEIAIGGILSTLGLERTFIYSVVGAIIVAVLVFLTARGRGLFRGALYTALWCGAGIGIIWFIGMIQTGALLNINTYLNALDILKVVGIPDGTVENVKASIRNALSFLSKEKPLEKPVAEKIGSWQALDVKLGSKYTEPPYSPKKVDANAGYFLPITVINPNKIESDIKIRNFWIRSDDCIKGTAGTCSRLPDGSVNYEGQASMDTSDNFKLMCGFADDCTNGKKCNPILPESEKEILISFDDKKPCSTLVNIYRTIEAGSLRGMEGVKRSTECYNLCNQNKWTYSTYLGKDIDSCICLIKGRESTAMIDEKIVNINSGNNDVSELCKKEFNSTMQIGNNALVEFIATFDFNVEGNSEFRVIQKETDVKILPKQKITTSTGPLGITTYFAPGYYSSDRPAGSIRMFIDVSNKGGGSANITKADISMPGSPVIKFNEQQLRKCIQDSALTRGLIISAGKEATVSCSLTPPTGIPTGTFATIPINVKMDYTYWQYYSQDLLINRIMVDSKNENEALLIGLPGYCAK